MSPFKMIVCIYRIPKEETLKLIVSRNTVCWENNVYFHEYLTTTETGFLKQFYFHKYLKDNDSNIHLKKNIT